MDAFTKLAAERGYSKTTVRDVVVEAGLSRRAFYDRFSDKRQCLLAAHDNFFARLVEEIEDAIDPDAAWPLQVRSAVAAALGFVTERIDAARLFTIEALAVGPPAVDRHEAAIQRLAGLLRHGRKQAGGRVELPALTEAALVSGAVYLVIGVLLAEDRAGLPRLESQLAEILLLPYAGAPRQVA